MMVNKANKAFNESTLGTPQAVDAAKNLVKANEQLNLGLEKKAKLYPKKKNSQSSNHWSQIKKPIYQLSCLMRRAFCLIKIES